MTMMTMNSATMMMWSTMIWTN